MPKMKTNRAAAKRSNDRKAVVFVAKGMRSTVNGKSASAVAACATTTWSIRHGAPIKDHLPTGEPGLVEESRIVRVKRGPFARAATSGVLDQVEGFFGGRKNRYPKPMRVLWNRAVRLCRTQTPQADFRGGFGSRASTGRPFHAPAIRACAG